eukprot:Phypoly_transcript_05249.p1 GENE.Phypoly_transcript_05249~~Phypoly_transcript_05249.p1  ORF type:complete len:509 (+),score=29.36 Phypoly_transcript_05249:166-1692(+)
MERNQEVAWFLDHPAASYDSDVYLALRPVTLPTICTASAQEVEGIMLEPISPPFTVVMSEAQFQVDHVLQGICRRVDSSPVVNREMSTTTNTRGFDVFTFLNTLAKDTSATAFSKSSEEVIAACWYDTVLEAAVSIASSLVPNFEVNRNVVDDSLTKPKLQRDLNCHVQRRLLLGGEIKRFPDDFDVACSELIDKTKAKVHDNVYGDLKYIITFVGAGDRGRFFYFDIQNKSKWPLLREFSLSDSSDRLQLACIGFNLLRWMRTVMTYLPELPVNLLARPCIFSKTGQTNLMRDTDKFVKQFTIPENNTNAWINIYKELLGTTSIRNTPTYRLFVGGNEIDVTRLDNMLDSDMKVTLHISPILSHKVPNNSAELMIAVTNVLECLEDLHKKNICHRDIRLPNVLFNNITGKYCLIDFECADVADRFIFWKGQPRFYVCPVYMKKQTYTFVDDLFQVGTLIGRVLLMRDGTQWAQHELVGWDSFADTLRARQLTATDALAALSDPHFLA